MKTLRLIPFLFLSLLIVVSCSNKNTDKSIYLPSISGKAGDLLIVMEKPQWEGEIGSILRDNLTADYPFLPQKEPIFTLYNSPHGSFKGGFLVHRNILILDISEDVDTSKVTITNDVWASPQIVARIYAKNQEDAINLIDSNIGLIINSIEQKERDRIINNSKKFEDLGLRKIVENNFGGSPYFTKDYSVKKATPDFIWISHETTYVNQGILMYKLPYKDLSEIDVDLIIPQIDSVLEANVPGMRDNSFMVIGNMLKPGMSYVQFKNRNFVEIRGLWELKNDFMGGPFICHIFPDKSNGYLTVIQGFVYAPKFDKRNYLRYVESILYSFDWKK